MDDVQLAERAAMLRDNQAFAAVVDEAEQDIIQAWKDADDVDAREQAHANLRGLRRIIIKLHAIIGRGEVEEDRRQRQESE